jgi:hypothetical protein
VFFDNRHDLRGGICHAGIGVTLLDINYRHGKRYHTL